MHVSMNYYCDAYIHACQNEDHGVYGDLNLYMSTSIKDLEFNMQQLRNILKGKYRQIHLL